VTIWSLLQICLSLFFLGSIAVIWVRLKRPPQDDPRLSRGLQLLQTKITILEDLSDRTDNQVKQLTSLLEQKTRMLQNKVLEAEQQIMKIDHSIQKSMEVAEIFQDKIPHEELVDRQQKIQYVRAARMAHSGANVDEIAKRVQLPKEQVELIAKFNREQLMFDESQLPEWATRSSLSEIDFAEAAKPQPDLQQMARIGDDFKNAVETVKQQNILDSRVSDTLSVGLEAMQPAVMSMKATARTFKERLVSTAEDLLRNQVALQSRPSVIKTESADPVQKVVFPRLDSEG